MDRPPGLEDDELPPGEDMAEPEAAIASFAEQQDSGIPGEAAAGQSSEFQAEAEETVAPPPPPVAPKKELTVIHVPLKIPEGARKKQVCRIMARKSPSPMIRY